jgi:hypothetical protein
MVLEAPSRVAGLGTIAIAGLSTPPTWSFRPWRNQAPECRPLRLMDFWFRRNAVEPVSSMSSSRSRVFFRLLKVREAVQFRIEFTRL